jgi:flagellar basal-body rod modification protein FlgD
MVDSVSNTNSTTASIDRSRTTIANNFDQFLSLLTTQLKNQSPLDPMDANQFTQQLVQFSGVEQQLKTNELLNSLLVSNKVNTATSAAAFIGQKVTADSAATPLKNGAAEWQLEFPRGTSDAKIEIKDKNGALVYSTKRTFQAGAQSFTWDGTTSTGAKAADGEYVISVKAADTAGGQMNVKTRMTGIVDGVDLSGDEPRLRIGAISIPVANISNGCSRAGSPPARFALGDCDTNYGGRMACRLFPRSA